MNAAASTAHRHGVCAVRIPEGWVLSTDPADRVAQAFDEAASESAAVPSKLTAPTERAC